MKIAEKFDMNEFLPAKIWNELKELRKRRKDYLKELVKSEGNERVRREELTEDGNLIILATDGPARGILSSGIDELAMACRRNYIGRILRVICGNPQVDGILGTPDVLEDLLLLNFLSKRHGIEDFLSRRLLIGVMNRLGIRDAVFELDDGMSAYTATHAREMGLDGVKMMFRYAPESSDSKKTIEYCLQAMNECHNYDLPVFLEAIAVEFRGGKLEQKEDIKSLMQVVCIASALSTSSVGTWLKLPYIKGSNGLTFKDVVDTTSYPTMILGGAATGRPEELVSKVNEAMEAGASGGLIGRTLLFPDPSDPYAVGKAISEVIHNRRSSSEETIANAMQLLSSEAGNGMDRFTKHFGVTK